MKRLFKYRKNKNSGRTVVGIKAHPPSNLARSANIFTAIHFLAASILSCNVFAVETAPRISDREIVERLTRLEEGQRAMREQFDQRFSSMQEQFDQRFSSMREQNESRFLSLEKRMDAQWNLTLVLIAAIFGLIGFVVWDRKTALKPLEKRFERIARDLEYELDLESAQGSRLSRLLHALRELSLKDPPLAEVLERFSVLDEGLPRKA